MTACENCDQDLYRDQWREYRHIEGDNYMCYPMTWKVATPRRVNGSKIARAVKEASCVSEGTSRHQDNRAMSVGVRSGYRERRPTANRASRQVHRSPATDNQKGDKAWPKVGATNPDRPRYRRTVNTARANGKAKATAPARATAAHESQTVSADSARTKE
jgi:hypothetical protein